MDGTSQAVAIVYPVANLDSVPMLCSAINLLAEHGYDIDIYTYRDQSHLAPVFRHAHIRTHSLRMPPRLPWRMPDNMLSVLAKAAWLAWLIGSAGRRRYAWVMGVDPEGLIMADRLSQITGSALAYLSLELFLSYELNTSWLRQLKRWERAGSRRSKLVIIQDEERAALLQQDNGLDPQQMVTVPNAPLGQGSVQRQRYFHAKYQLPPETRVILHAGSVGEWTCTRDLIRSTHAWPESWRLIIHTRYKASQIGLSAEFTKLQALAAPGRVIFSGDPVPHDAYEEIIRSADIGVAFYREQPGYFTQSNLRALGLSSGKVAYFLKNGVPILVNDIRSLRHLVQAHECGQYVSDPAQTTQAIAAILEHYEEYTAKAARTFNERLEFTSRFSTIIERMDKK